jgi:hypothetical protein
LGDSPVVAPDFLKACAVEVYFTDPGHRLAHQGYPSIIAADGRIEAAPGLAWLARQIGE